jgi:hypothetical protein
VEIRHSGISELGRDACLFADFVSCDPINLPVAFDGDHMSAVGVDGVVCPFPEQMEAVFLQIASEITSLD